MLFIDMVKKKKNALDFILEILRISAVLKLNLSYDCRVILLFCPCFSSMVHLDIFIRILRLLLWNVELVV